MLILSGADLNGLISDIAARVRNVIDHNGKPVVLPTMTDHQLRAAALTAMMTATGQMIWPGDQPLDLRQEEQKNPYLTVQR